MYYTIYKTTNTINGKFYIGKHQTKDLNDGYVGSGKLLKRAIRKYGIDNFHTEILHVCESEKQMNALEKILVVPDPELNYNLCPGGHGGFGYINDRKLWHTEKHNNAAIKNLQKGKINRENYFKSGIHSSKMKPINKKWIQEKYPNGIWLGKKHTQETKDKIGQINSIKQSGQLNSQYGTCWITNGIENKKIKKEELDSWIELGYNKGRKV